MLTLKNLKSPKGANRNTKRLGRGQASGQGTQAGKGHKGQKARKSGHVRLGFEGNNLPLYMRLPKVNVFSNIPFKTEYAIVDISVLENKFTESEEISREALIEKGLLKGINKRLPIKVLAKEKKLGKKLNFTGIEKFSQGAEELVKSAGGAIK